MLTIGRGLRSIVRNPLRSGMMVALLTAIIAILVALLHWRSIARRSGKSIWLAAAPLKPACCWEKMQDVTVSVKGDSTVMVRAKVGLEGGMKNESKTRAFKLVKEDGVWKMSQADILSLSGAAKKKTAHTKKKNKAYNQ
jgi:hypothetical protein